MDRLQHDDRTTTTTNPGVKRFVAAVYAPLALIGCGYVAFIAGLVSLTLLADDPCWEGECDGTVAGRIVGAVIGVAGLLAIIVLLASVAGAVAFALKPTVGREDGWARLVLVGVGLVAAGGLFFLLMTTFFEMHVSDS